MNGIELLIPQTVSISKALWRRWEDPAAVIPSARFAQTMRRAAVAPAEPAPAGYRALRHSHMPGIPSLRNKNTGRSSHTPDTPSSPCSILPPLTILSLPRHGCAARRFSPPPAPPHLPASRFRPSSNPQTFDANFTPCLLAGSSRGPCHVSSLANLPTSVKREGVYKFVHVFTAEIAERADPCSLRALQ